MVFQRKPHAASGTTNHENADLVRRPKDDWPKALQTGTSVPGPTLHFHKRMLPPCGALLPLLVMLAFGSVANADGTGTDLLSGAEGAVSLEPGKWLAEVPLDKSKSVQVFARWTFTVDKPVPYLSLTLDKPIEMDHWTLNGAPVPIPLEGMRYSKIPAIPARLIKEGENLLEADWKATVRSGVDVVRPAALPVHLLGLTESDLDFQTGPVLGPAGTDFFTVSCRTTAPATVTVEAGGKRTVSPLGVVHTLKVKDLKPNTAYSYKVTAKVAGSRTTKQIGPFTVRTLPSAPPFRFVALGDSRSRPDMWAQVAKGTLQSKPAFVIDTGDLVASGRDYDLWDTQFFGVNKDFFATIPLFAVQGNHDEDSPIFHRMYDVVPGEQNWTQVVGPVLFIGINARLKWRDDSANLKWLDTVLAASKQKFIFFVSHYAGWSSGPGGDAKKGVLLDSAVQDTQTFIMPLLARYHATATLAGHSHFYERSEPPGGVTVIITGGAGAPLYEKRPDAAAVNPYSRAFSRQLNFCVFDVDGDKCRMSVLGADGKEIDSRTWDARTVDSPALSGEGKEPFPRTPAGSPDTGDNT
jgi:acid phosphatase type 7